MDIPQREATICCRCRCGHSDSRQTSRSRQGLIAITRKLAHLWTRFADCKLFERARTQCLEAGSRAWRTFNGKAPFNQVEGTPGSGLCKKRRHLSAKGAYRLWNGSFLYLIVLLQVLQLLKPCVGAAATLCADSEPTDILALAISDTQSYSDGVELVNVNGVQGYRFGPSALLAGVDSDVIFVHCDRFPAEFSILVNFNHKMLSTNNEFIMTLLAQDRRTVLVALRMRSRRLYFDYMAQDEVRSVNVRDERFTDGNWHTLVVTVSRRMVKFTVDCMDPVEKKLATPFPKRMNIRNTRTYVASRRKKMKQFTGLLRQLVIFPGSDATMRVCPSTNPPLSGPSPGQNVLFASDQQKVDCSLARRGTLMYNEDRSMEICTGTAFQPVRGGRERMDYVIDYDDINLENATVSMEWMKINGVGIFLALAGGDGVSSQLMKWERSRFNPYQWFSLKNIMHWEYFEIGYDSYLAASVRDSDCTIFRWHRRTQRFVFFQSLKVEDARNSEFFSEGDRHFLAVAVYGNESALQSPPRSVVYEFKNGIFTFFQSLDTTGAVDITFFSVEESVFCLAVASAYSRGSFVRTSSIFCGLTPITSFINSQDIITYGATDWEFFKIDDRYFLVVANGVNSTRPIMQGESVNSTDSIIYELNYVQTQFQVYQKISTQNAYDWEFFTIGSQYFLAVTSTFSEDGGIPKVKIYRWKGYEKFVLEHTLPFGTALDIDYIPIDGEHYLAVSNPKTSASSGYRGDDPLGSKLYKIVTY